MSDSPPPSHPPAAPSSPTGLFGQARTVADPTDAAPAGADGPSAPAGYEILGVLGRGGMGVVYKARQTALGREVAVKMILGGGHAAPGELIRFETEARAVAAVRHPNVVQVFHAGRHAGLPFLVMELLPHGTLAGRLRDGPLPPADAARVVEQVAAGVAACHAVGVLHRDLKPGNVLLGDPPPAGTGSASTVTPGSPRSTAATNPPAGLPVPKVTDFGLAKRLDAGDGLTFTGAVLGTPNYMAPEQARGAKEVGPAADVYGLGAILYACLTGRPPFQAPTVQETLRRVTDDEPLSVRQLQPAVPRDLETVCLKALAKDPAGRYPSAADLAADLRRWLDGRPVLARPAGPAERGWKWVRRNRGPAAVGLALAVGLGVAAWQAVRADDARRQAEADRRDADDARRAAEASEREERRARAAEAEAAGYARDDRDFLISVLTQSSPASQAVARRTVDPNLPVKAALDHAAARIGDAYRDRPRDEARLRATVARIYFELKLFAAAVGHWEKALAICEQRLPADHPERLEVTTALGEGYRQVGRLDDAERLLRAAVDGYRRTLGGHPETFRAENNLGLLLQSKRRYADAEPVLRAALAGRRAVLGDRHADTLKSANNLALCLYWQERYADAEPLLREALAGRRDVLGELHPDTISTIGNLAEVYRYWGKPLLARPLFEEAAASAERAEPEAVTTPARRLALGRFLYECGLYADAEPHLLAAHPRLTAAARGQAARMLADIYGSTCRPERAAEWEALASPRR